jgi:uncharacterized protein YbcI
MASAKFDPTATGPSGLAVANHVVRLFSEYTGRGATKARTTFSQDLVTVVVHDTLGKGEHTLVRDGRSALVLEMRRAYQEITGRDVLAFLSANHVDPDVAVESFVLVPIEDDEAPR